MYWIPDWWNKTRQKGPSPGERRASASELAQTRGALSPQHHLLWMRPEGCETLHEESCIDLDVRGESLDVIGIFGKCRTLFIYLPSQSHDDAHTSGGWLTSPCGVSRTPPSGYCTSLAIGTTNFWHKNAAFRPLARVLESLEFTGLEWSWEFLERQKIFASELAWCWTQT